MPSGSKTRMGVAPPRQEARRHSNAIQWAVCLIAATLSLMPAPTSSDSGIDIGLIEDGPDKPLDAFGKSAIPWTEEPAQWWYDGGVTAEVHFISRTVETEDGGVAVEVKMLSATIESVIYYSVGPAVDEIDEPTMETGTLYDDEKPVLFKSNGYIKAVAFHMYALDSALSISDHIRVKVRSPQLFVRAGDLHPFEEGGDAEELIALQLDPPTMFPAGAQFEGPVRVYAVARTAVYPYTPNIQLAVDGEELVLSAPAGVGQASIILTRTTVLSAIAWQYGLDPSDEVSTGLLKILPAANGRTEGFAGLLGWWDLGGEGFYFGNSTREATGCGEKYATQIIPAKVVDRQGTLGPAVMFGPDCKGGAWDVDPGGQSECEVHKVLYRAYSGCSARGESEVLQGVGCAISRQPSLLSLATVRNGIRGLKFDQMINRELFVTHDIEAHVAHGRLPVSALSVEMQFLMSPDALSASRMFGLISALQADTGGLGPGMSYQRGWSLVSTVDAARGTLSLIFSVAVAANMGPSGTQRLSSVSYTAPASDFAVGWVYLNAVYDRSKLSLFVNGTLVRSSPACDDVMMTPGGDCGDVTYPRLRDPLSMGKTPFVLGAYHNAHSGVVLPHQGLIGRIRLYDGVLNGYAVSAGAQRLEEELDDEVCQEGSFGAYEGFVPCLPCPRGEFNPFEARTECTKCSVGSFTDSEGSIACTSCPVGTTTESTGTGDMSGCIDPDECKGFLGVLHDCHRDAECINTPGSFDCSCKTGFEGTGWTCSPTCGDGMLVDGEGCDDGNLNPTDGCSSECSVEEGFSCAATATEAGLNRSFCTCEMGTAACCQREYAKCLVDAGWLSRNLVPDGVYKGEDAAQGGSTHWILAAIGETCTEACDNQSPRETCVDHTFSQARGAYFVGTALPQAIRGGLARHGGLCSRNITQASLSFAAPLLADAAALPMVDELGGGGEGSVLRSGPVSEYVGSVCYLWDAASDASSNPPSCDAPSPIASARRVCQCRPQVEHCGRTCVADLVTCVRGEGPGKNYTEGVAETFVPCLDDPEISIVTCNGNKTEAQAQCDGKNETFGCSDYASGAARYGFCVADGLAQCDKCPQACNLCGRCFQEGGTYYYGGVEKPHPDKYKDGYVTDQAMQRCAKGLAFCTENGFEACLAAGKCDPTCELCNTMKLGETVESRSLGGNLVASCSCSEWYRACANKVYL